MSPRLDHRRRSRRPLALLILAVAIVMVVLAVVLGATLGTLLHHHHSGPSGSSTGSGTSSTPTPTPSPTQLPTTKYQLSQTYQGSTFFDGFNYFSNNDPSAGFVQYQNASGAAALNLTYVGTEGAVIRMDNQSKRASEGRKSIRLMSKSTYSSGLFIFDVQHTPVGCGVWPAIWMVDETNYPEYGEIDILEAVNDGTAGNRMTLYSSAGCTMPAQAAQRSGMTGQIVSNDCADLGGTGCCVQGNSSTYGPAINLASNSSSAAPASASGSGSGSAGDNGALYVLEWQPATGLGLWFWPRGDAPAAIVSAISQTATTNTTTSGSDSGAGSDAAAPAVLESSSWRDTAKPLAAFPSTAQCDLAAHFRNQTLVININLCGHWAESQYSATASCRGSCKHHAAGTPSAFDQAYWQIGGIWVYQPI